MSIFPVINTIEDYLPHIEGKDYIGVNKQSNGATVVCYNISNGTSFTTKEEKEARGLSFDKDGNIIARPLHKFFNLAEREEVQPKNLDFSKIAGVYDKMDGSMITTGFMDGEFFCKSKKSFKSDVAVSAEVFCKENQKYFDFAKYCSLAMLTPIFEFTSPKHRIVLRYDSDNMTILHIRHMVTGEYLMPWEILKIAAKFDIPYNQPVFGSEIDMTGLVNSLNTVEGIEGYVVQFQNGEMFKIKTKWYVDLHHLVTFKRQRDIARMVIDETIDDFIGYLSLNAPLADLSEVNSINLFITNFVSDLEKEIKELAAPFIGKPFKEAATSLEKGPKFYLVMGLLRGNTNNYLQYYLDYHLKEHWSLDEIDLGDLGGFQIGNQKQEDY